MPELTLEHINKQRVQLRPKRRPPTRDFVRSRASMDFDFTTPEEIKEEENETNDQNEARDNEETSEIDTPVEPTSMPTPPPKPERNGWKLPTPGSEVVLRKTKSDNEKSEEIKEEIEDHINDITPQSSPEKKYKERKRFKMHFIKFRRSRKGKQDGKNKEPETQTNLSHARSVDSGLQPLGENSRRRWPHRRFRGSDEKGVSWLLSLFHKKSPQQNNDTNDTQCTISEETESTTKNAEDLSKVNVSRNHSDRSSNSKDENSGTDELTNGDTSHNADGENQESVSNLRQKFERISGAY